VPELESKFSWSVFSDGNCQCGTQHSYETDEMPDISNAVFIDDIWNCGQACFSFFSNGDNHFWADPKHELCPVCQNQSMPKGQSAYCGECEAYAEALAERAYYRE
jgi:hypothetical protein